MKTKEEEEASINDNITDKKIELEDFMDAAEVDHFTAMVQQRSVRAERWRAKHLRKDEELNDMLF
jgi:hypothetical protein